MARIELKKMYPFTDDKGNFDNNSFVTLEIETSKTKAGNTPFRVIGYRFGERAFFNIDEALEFFNWEVKEQSKSNGWKGD